MADRECVLRFIAFRDRRWLKYGSSDDLDRWLGDAMNAINRASDIERTSVRDKFENAMLMAHDIFRPHAFRKRYGVHDRQRPINKALFETWSVGLAQAGDQRSRLLAERGHLVDRFHDLMNQPDFDAAVSTATGTASKLRYRFRAVEELIEECL